MINKKNFLAHAPEELGVKDAVHVAIVSLRAGECLERAEEITLDENRFENVIADMKYELWSEWSDEMRHEFYNNGTECCPEYDYPEFPFFYEKD